MENENETKYVIEIDHLHFIATYDGKCDYLEVKALISHAAREVGNMVVNPKKYCDAINQKLKVMGITLEPSEKIVVVF